MWFIDVFKRLFGKPNYPKCVFPLPILPDGRKGQVTSASKWHNSSRPTHNGDDWMYKRAPGDVDPKGDGGGTSNGKWNVPAGTVCLAVRDGLVRGAQYGSIKTGYRVYLQHEDGYRSGYFHLSRILVKPGQFVKCGQAVGVIGHNPAVVDPNHLHFEISEGVSYEPVDPMRYLKNHKAQHAKER